MITNASTLLFFLAVTRLHFPASFHLGEARALAPTSGIGGKVCYPQAETTVGERTFVLLTLFTCLPNVCKASSEGIWCYRLGWMKTGKEPGVLHDYMDQSPLTTQHLTTIQATNSTFMVLSHCIWACLLQQQFIYLSWLFSYVPVAALWQT